MTTPVPHGDDADRAARYDFSFGPETPYAHAVDLVDRWRALGGEVVVDLGCGYGAIAEPVRALGLTYLGIDRDPDAVRSLEGRGAEAAVCDLSTPGALLALVERALGARRVAAFTMLDAAEHLANAAEILAALSGFSGARGAAPLVVSIPNVSHRDLATKLLLGRWDVTPTGLLDETHVRFFAPSTLDRAMAVAGWAELEAHDFALEVSDQHFPADCVALGPTTPIGALLRRVRETAAPGAVTNQFVRAYRTAGEAPATGRVDPDVDPEGALAAAPFLSVIIRTGGSDPGAFERLVTSLAAQRSGDFEVVVVALQGELDAPGAPSGLGAGEETLEMAIEVAQRRHETLAGRIRLVVPPSDAQAFSTRSAAADTGVDAARGRYVALLCEGDLASAGWVGGLEAAAARLGGRVLSTGSVAGITGVGLVDLVATAPGAICGFAFPRSAWRDMGVRFSDMAAPTSGGGAAAPEEWRVLLRAVELCGCTPASGGAPGGGGPGSGGTGDDQRDDGVEHGAAGRDGGGTGVASAARHAALLELLDAEPLLLDRGSATRLAMLHGGGGDPSAATALLGARIEELERAHADAEARLASLLASSSWRVTAPLRAATRWWRTR